VKADLAELLDCYDALQRELAETYGMKFNHGPGNRSVAGLHEKRHQLAANIAEVRGQILEYGRPPYLMEAYLQAQGKVTALMLNDPGCA
jgi:hypothetical protein